MTYETAQIAAELREEGESAITAEETLRTIHAQLQEANPEQADSFELRIEPALGPYPAGGDIRLVKPDGSACLMYSTLLTGGVAHCQMADGSYPAIPAAIVAR